MKPIATIASLLALSLPLSLLPLSLAPAAALAASPAPAAAESGQQQLGANELPLHDLARLGSGAQVAAYLKAHPEQRDARTAQGLQAVHLAATNPDSSALKVLLAAGADPNAKDQDNSTPLHMAVYTQNAKHSQMLLEAGADPLAKTNNGRDVLSLARKARADEAAGIISLWVLKGCKAGKPC